MTATVLVVLLLLRSVLLLLRSAWMLLSALLRALRRGLRAESLTLLDEGGRLLPVVSPGRTLSVVPPIVVEVVGAAFVDGLRVDVDVGDRRRSDLHVADRLGADAPPGTTARERRRASDCQRGH